MFCKIRGYYAVFLTCIGIKGTQQVSSDWNPGWNWKWLRPGTFKPWEKWRVCLHTAPIVDSFLSTGRICPRAAIDCIGSFHSFFFQFKMKAQNRGHSDDEPMRKKLPSLWRCAALLRLHLLSYKEEIWLFVKRKKKTHNPSLSLISLLHGCIITTLPLLQARGIMTRNDLRARSAFHLAVGELSGADAFLITSRLFDHLFIHTFANELFSCPAFGALGEAHTRTHARTDARTHRCTHAPREQRKPLQSLWRCRTAEVGTWSVGPRW